MIATLTTFLFEIANFIVLAALLGWLFFKPVRQALADRQAKLADTAERAARKLAQAEQALQEINARRADLQAELSSQRAREVAAARGQAEKLLHDARAAAERERELSRRQAARMSAAQQDVLGQVAAAAAGDTVGRLLEQISGPQLHAALIEAACRQLGEHSPQALSPVKIESTQPLSDEQRVQLQDALGGAAAATKFRTIDGLGAGVRILTSQGLIDATVSGLSHFARQSLVSQMNYRANNHNPLHGIHDG